MEILAHRVGKHAANKQRAFTSLTARLTGRKAPRVSLASWLLGSFPRVCDLPPTSASVLQPAKGALVFTLRCGVGGKGLQPLQVFDTAVKAVADRGRVQVAVSRHDGESIKVSVFSPLMVRMS